VLPVLPHVEEGDRDRLNGLAQVFRQPGEERGDVASLGVDGVFAAVGIPQMVGKLVP
jgi:hypothetical protein